MEAPAQIDVTFVSTAALTHFSFVYAKLVSHSKQDGTAILACFFM